MSTECRKDHLSGPKSKMSSPILPYSHEPDLCGYNGLPEVLVPGGDFSSNQMHKDSVMGRRSFAGSLMSDGPIPLNSQLGTVLREKHLVYCDFQISEILEIVKDRALYVLLDHVTSGRKQLSVW